MRQYPVSVLECTKDDLQAPLSVISNEHRAILEELLALYEFPLLSIQTLEHGPKETLQSISSHTSLLTEVHIDLPSLHPCPEAPAMSLVLNLLRPGIICVITGFVVLLFA
jgi:hypothetical protein